MPRTSSAATTSSQARPCRPASGGALWLLVVLTLACAWSNSTRGAEPIVLYSTGFENTEGFDPRFELIGQGGWQGAGTGGNGIAVGAFPGRGQQGYVGLFAPTDTNDVLSVWRPASFLPASNPTSIVHFSVTFQIVASANRRGDDFRWSVYNTNGVRLFSVEFETSTKLVSYLLDQGPHQPANVSFDHEGSYDLDLFMDFRRNQWTAVLNGAVIINSKPIASKRELLTFGDVDAVWSVRTANAPGDNYMLFDDYRVAVEPMDSIPPTLQQLGRNAKGEFDLRVFGGEGVNYRIDVSEDFKSWFALGVFTAPVGGIFDYRDITAPTHKFSFYSVAQVP